MVSIYYLLLIITMSQRVASILNNIRHLPLIYALAFGILGIPCVYYGSEWGATGRKEDGDPALRTCFDIPVFNELSDWIAKLANAKKTSPALQYGNFSSIVLTNEQCVFLREWRGERVLVAINALTTIILPHLIWAVTKHMTL